MARRLVGGVLAVFVIEVDELVSMHAVEGEHDHDHEVGDEQRGIEPVPAVEMLEGVVAVVVTKIVAEIVLRLEERERSGVKTKRAFESNRFQQGRASREWRDKSLYCS